MKRVEKDYTGDLLWSYWLCQDIWAFCIDGPAAITLYLNRAEMEYVLMALKHPNQLPPPGVEILVEEDISEEDLMVFKRTGVQVELFPDVAREFVAALEKALDDR